MGLRPHERVPLHDHADSNSGGLIAASSPLRQVLNSGGGSGSAPLASQVPVQDSAGNFAGSNVETVLAEIAADITAHLSDASDAHAASAVSVLDTAGLFTATDVEAALAEIALGSTFLHNIEALGDIPLGLAEL